MRNRDALLIIRLNKLRLKAYGDEYDKLTARLNRIFKRYGLMGE